MKFLYLPKIENALVAVLYQHSPKKYPWLREYIKVSNVLPVPESELHEGMSIYLTPKKWPEWHFCLSSRTESISGEETINDKSTFILKKAHSGQENLEWMMESKHFSDSVITAKQTCTFLGSEPEESVPKEVVDKVQGKDASTHKQDQLPGGCLLSCPPSNCKCSRNCYMYTKMNLPLNVKWCSYNYVWRFTKLEEIGGCSYYFISATQRNFGPGYWSLLAA